MPILPLLRYWRDELRDAPTCTMVPLALEEKAPEGWVDLDGRYQILRNGPDYWCFDLLKARFTEPLILDWWTQWGGLVFPRLIQVPNIPSDEVWASAFGVEAQDQELKLILKVRNV